jgi:hypothetical protein
VEHVTLSAEPVPAPPAGWRLGGSALRVIGTPPAGAATGVAVSLSARDLASAGGIWSGLAVFALDASGQWTRVTNQSLGSTGQLTFTPPTPGVYAVLARDPLAETGDYAVAGGRFFRTGPVGGFSVRAPPFGPSTPRSAAKARLAGRSAGASKPTDSSYKSSSAA